MNRWAARILLLVMLLAFGLMFVMLYKQLVMLQRSAEKQSALPSVVEASRLGTIVHWSSTATVDDCPRDAGAAALRVISET